jgi:hypothetical protein
VSWEEVLIATWMIVVTAVTYSAVGLFFSSFIRRTLASTVLAYATSIQIVFGIPLILLIVFSMINSFWLGGFNRFGIAVEVLVYILGWVVISINPLTAAIASEMMLLEQQKFFYTTLPLSNGRLFPVISPWLSYSVFYLIVSLLLILISIGFVKRVDKS